nr:decapping nuclease RAI1 [Cryptococcus depauperatus CBS 7855]
MPNSIHFSIPKSFSSSIVPAYRLPHLIHTYSHLPSRAITHNDASMAYYSPAPIGCNLMEGFERRIEREDEDEHLDGLVESLEVMGRRAEKGERGGGIITWRGMLTRLLISPYERDGWEMTALALDGSVYLELWDPPEIKAKRKADQAAWEDQAYMGYSYESFSTIPVEGRPEDGPEGWGGDVNTNVQVRSVVRSAIGNIPLCMAGEVDCVKGERLSFKPIMNTKLKTNKIITNAKSDLIFHKKLLKHWAQSWLLGIPEVVVGFRTDAGTLASQETFETAKIPHLVAYQRPVPWSPNPCLHTLYSICSLLVIHVLPTDPLVTYPHIRGNPARVEATGSVLPPAVVWRLKFDPLTGFDLWVSGEVGVVDGRWGGVLKEEYVKWRMDLH